ncbi:MAG: hypothetical protein WCO22_00450 [Betaproteobacteria bacterium]
MAHSAALLFTVAMLMVTAYFLLGSLPLLILKHDNPVDAKFIRAFFNMYYRLALVTALGAAVSYALSGRPGFAVGAAANAALMWVLRGHVIPRLVALESRIKTEDLLAIPAFRQMHKTAILINLGQLVVILASLGAY